VLFNDRYGLLRLYYHEDRTAVYFASEAKAILKILPAVRRVDEQGLAEFLTLGCVLQQRTIFTGIKLLPGASAWQFGPSSEIRRETYFDRSTWENQAPLEGADYFEQLVATWKQILPSYFAGGQDVAISMTGGLDSRMILAWTPRGAGTVPCYTFGGPRRDSADVRLARKVASICGQPHTVITVGRDFLRRFPHFAEKSVFVSDAAMDASGAVDVYIQQLSRQLAPVRLSGVNGGEILRSLVAFKPRQFSDELLCPEIARLSKTAATTYRHELEGHRLSFIAFRQTPWFMTAKFAIEHSQVVFRTPYFDNRLVQLAYRAPAELHGSTAPALQLIAKGNRALADIRTDRGLGAGAVPGGVMAARLFQEFTFKAEYAYDYGMPQWLATLDHRLSVMRLERFFLGRHKFHHFRTYYRDELAGFVKEVLLDPRSLGRSYVNPRSMRKAVAAHTEGRRNYTVELHRLLACELMHRLFIEST
jgi:asparagine synthase (glutamine-hydrolysing)